MHISAFSVVTDFWAGDSRTMLPCSRFLDLGDDHDWWIPFYCHPVFEGKITWPPVIAVLFPQLYSLILGHRFFLHKGSGFTPFPPLEGLIAGKKDISVSFSWIESHLAPSLGPLAASIMTPRCSESLTVCVCLFRVGRQCGPFTPVQSKADLRRSNKWLDFIVVN